MAISDINLQVKTEQGTGFSGKDSESSDKASGLSFLTSLTEASEAANAQANTTPQTKSDADTHSVDETKAISISEEPKSDAKLGDENTTADAKVATATTSTQQQSKTSPDIRNEAVTKEPSDELALVEDEENSLLSQINAAQAMSTRVNKLIENNDFSPVVVDKKPTPIDTITPVIPSPMTDVAQTDDSKADAEGDNSIASLLHKSKVATAVDSQLKAIGDLPPKDSVTPIVDGPLTDKEKQGVSAVNTPDTKPQVANFASSTQATDNKETTVDVDALLNSAQKQAVNSDATKTSEGKELGANETSKTVLNKVVADLNSDAQVDTKTAEVNSKQTQSYTDKTAANFSAEQSIAKNIEAGTAKMADKPADAAAKIDQAVTEKPVLDKPVTDKSIVSLLAKVQSGDGQAVSEFAKGLSLTSEQQKQLEQQINQLKADNKLGADEVATIKLLLTDVNSSKPTTQAAQSPVSQLAVEQDIAEESQAKQDAKLADNKALDNKLPTGVEKQITALTKDEQQALLNKVNTQLQTLTPGTAQYEKLAAAQTVLTEAINAPATASTAMPVTAATVNVENNKAKPNNTAQITADVTKVVASEEVTTELDTKINTERTQETVTVRVAQLFTQLTTQANATTQPGAYEMAHQQYEQALDVQTMHTQTTAQTQTQSKSVNVDPGVMQAINIIKSDAAKMLQERVSALLNINNKEAEIRLDPPEMGSMQIRIRSDAEQAQINFVVQNQQAKEALEQSMPRLREMLAQQGIELGESSIQQGNPEQQQEQSGQGQLAGNQQAEEQQPEVTAQSAETSRQQSSSSIDYYA
ncbi:flagellar hook-length control protein FliK [Pseudoalteromonas shioyasakiensis]|uniref:Flagellar hook-length control protein FliK n=1 Tax=Pseudoalteromonas shioyasakiensis TaxID=1190813 RepID=A0ABT6U0A8_9GAMM|nr:MULTISPECIES: flagellar hook-length control protein FliK [Pseudoalteromonas]MDI4669594.1 flagellar hook-length control protein FliK [Pseudoalteromonas shioyasakiensis]MDI4674413.1 flagellar hook-length control protein FliK [Pseudoalteromonas shioyasakiensis]MDI4686454.1 flagellar hook-length control protein FliK [Pseudoalteromonas shioyasakiensis]MDI4704744.1 flagellar hook-length control protein FliK [Pseudoalteromonas shioyasakiensis]NUJ21425.1 flagellar hook-length control protein FliK [